MKKNILLIILLTISGVGLYYYESPKMKIETQSKIKELTPKIIDEESVFDSKSNLSFDIIRITKNGDAVFAGRALPDINIELFDGDLKLADLVSDANGEWVWSSQKPLMPGARNFFLKYIDKSGDILTSEKSVLIYIDKKNEPLILKSDLNGHSNSVILNLDELESDISLDIVEYSPTGLLFFSGRSDKNIDLSIHVNEELIGYAKANEEGDWKFESEEKFDYGKLNLSISFFRGEEKISLKTRIFNEKLEKIQNKLLKKKFVVQPGNSLWRIARKTLGGGILYTEILKKNLKIIKNPDLIYPGQVLGLPILTSGLVSNE